MCPSPALQNGEDIVSHQLELQSDGVHGRCVAPALRRPPRVVHKHDTARLRFIKDTAFPGKMVHHVFCDL